MNARQVIEDLGGESQSGPARPNPSRKTEPPQDPEKQLRTMEGTL